MSAERIRRARELAGLSVYQASRLLGILESRLEDLEAGRITPDDLGIRALADVYGCSMAWLRGAAPVVPQHVRAKLRGANISERERDEIIELLGSAMTPEER